MTDKPIIFSASMVKALLDGRKTKTRRVLKPQPDARSERIEVSDGQWSGIGPSSTGGTAQWDPWRRLPYAIGDRLFPAADIPTLNRNYCADLFGEIWSRAGDGETWRRLVAEAFYGPAPEGLLQVRHLNGNELDNAPENLDWGTQEDNWSDCIAHGGSTGEDHPAAKLTRQQVDEIRASPGSQRILANRYGVAQSTIWAAKTGRLWAEAPAPNPPNMLRWASRLTLTVTDMRVQRLQEISEDDARAEGMQEPSLRHLGGQLAQAAWSERQMFARLWNHLHGPAAWDANPWVVALTFTVERRNIDAKES